MTQLKLPIDSIDCRHFQDCDAPICPKDINAGQCAWFPPEPVCRLRDAPEWVRRQRRIAKLPGVDPERYFTLRILRTIKEVEHGVQGIDPESAGGETAWLARRSANRRPESKAETGGQFGTHDFEIEPSRPRLFW